jgi:opacity protein-like surface antigen
MRIISRLALAAIAVAGVSLSAQDVRFGIQGQVNIPTGDLKKAVDSKLGFGLGGHSTIDFSSGHVLRPRLDYNFYPEAKVSGIKNNVSNLSLGADYMYFIEGKPSEGFYVTGGLAAVRWNQEVEVLGVKDKINTTKLGIAAGAGYQFNPTVGVEVRYTTSSVNKDSDANAIQIGATIRF